MPAEVYALDPYEYMALVDFANEEIRRERQQARRRR